MNESNNNEVESFFDIGDIRGTFEEFTAMINVCVLKRLVDML